MTKEAWASLLHGDNVQINFTIGDEPCMGDAISAIVPHGDGPRSARLVIIDIPEKGLYAARKPLQGGGGGCIELRIPRQYLYPEREGREWIVSQTQEGLFKEII